MSIHDDITAERHASPRDAADDDARKPGDWIDALEVAVDDVDTNTGEDRRRNLVRLAHVAVSAAESHDRLLGRAPTLSVADKAVLHLLDQLQRNAELGWVIGYGTQAFDLLCEAEAIRTGEDKFKVKQRRSISLVPPAAKPGRRRSRAAR